MALFKNLWLTLCNKYNSSYNDDFYEHYSTPSGKNFKQNYKLGYFFNNSMVLSV